MNDPAANDRSDLDAALEDFLGKWRGRWPEWRIAQAFVAESERATAEAWFALLQEWTDAAWAGDDPTPGFAKLAWWQEELQGWAKGLRRHPLGRVLQKRPAPWTSLAAALASLQAVRDPLRAWAAPQPLMVQLRPLADAIADCERAIFSSGGESGGDTFLLLAAHALWHRDEAAEAAQMQVWARQLATTPPQRAGSRPRRIHDALSHARLRRVAAAGEVSALSPALALWRSWRAARG
ncbi:MAG: phytoene/squalene synthase family protein [Pseudomonadota bacterium]